MVEDRDVNAALNLKQLAGSFSVTACRHGSADLVPADQVKLLSGQEPDTVGASCG